MSTFTSHTNSKVRAALVDLHNGGWRNVQVEGDMWYATQYTANMMSDGAAVRECHAEGWGDAKRMYVAADGSYFFD